MALRKVRLVHDKHGGEYLAPEGAVAFWEARGWRNPDEPRTVAQSEKAAPAPQTKPAARAVEKGGK